MEACAIRSVKHFTHMHTINTCIFALLTGRGVTVISITINHGEICDG